MSQSLAKIPIHLVFSIKHRSPWIPPDARDRLFRYQSGIFQAWDSPALAIGGVEDHVHALFLLSRSRPLSKVVEEVKKGISRWMKTADGAGNREFCWQSGYAAFSVSESNAPSVREYIASQERRHRKTTFQDELRALLLRHQVAYDERYVWD